MLSLIVNQQLNSFYYWFSPPACAVGHLG